MDKLQPKLAYALSEIQMQKKSLPEAVLHHSKNLSPKGKSEFKHALFESCRWFYLIEKDLNRLLESPIKAKSSIIKYLLITAFCQIKFTNKPSFAVVNEAVNAAKGFKFPWGAGLVNAVCKKYSKSLSIETKQNDHISSHPKWLMKAINKNYSNVSFDIAKALNAHPPLYLRVNKTKVSIEDFSEMLKNSKVEYKVIDETLPCIEIITKTQIEKLPGYDNGLFYVQDLAPMQVPRMLSLKPEDSVLDVCAAPGGKTTHLVEACPEINLTAIDISKTRLETLKENLERMQVSDKVNVLCQDATTLPESLGMFDKIIIDAPCSASGVIKRQPDIKLIRKERDIEKVTACQSKILEACWRHLKVGGELLYATCSIIPAENSEQIRTFLTKNTDAKQVALECSLPHKDTKYGLQIIPSKQSDGFFYALIKKQE